MTTKKVAAPKKGKITKKAASTEADQTQYWANQTDYELDVNHPHRSLIVGLVAAKEFSGLLEVGCDVGQNLERIQEIFPETQLAGVDVNARAIDQAKVNLPKPVFKVGDVTALPFEDKSFDVVLADAVLMYVKDIDKALGELTRVARQRLIILDWQSPKEELIGHSLARNYEKLLAERGEVEVIKITEEIWPTSEKWQEHGQCFVVHLA